MSEFGYGELREYQPQHGGVNWEAVNASNNPDSTELPVWFEHSDELGVLQIQVHQENCVIWLNKTDPKFDCLVLVDPRDGNAFWYSRDNVGTEKFDQIAEAIGNEVMVARTRYPSKSCVEYVLMVAARELNQFLDEGDGAA